MTILNLKISFQSNPDEEHKNNNEIKKFHL